MGFIDSPQRVWWRRALFQIHLWGGLILCLYTAVIGLTGSLLVFESELEHAAYPGLWRSSAPQAGTAVSFASALTAVRAAYPGYDATVGYVPDHPGHNYEVFVHKGGAIRYVFVDAVTGKIAGAIDPKRSWVVWIVNLHFRLLMGRTGLLLNGIGAAGLLLLSLTGIVIWWAGLARWMRRLKVNLHRNWCRINYDMHSAVGFWTLAIVSMWAFTGIYFVWPRQMESLVNRISSTASANPPKFDVPSRRQGEQADWSSMIRQAKVASPGTKFAGAFLPASNKAALTLLMARGELRNFSQMDYVYFDPATGKQLAIWHRGINTTAGAKFIFWLGPLHFGYDWGLAVKILWAVLGCALPLLAMTGVLMYWNRCLKRKWRNLALKTERERTGKLGRSDECQTQIENV